MNTGWTRVLLLDAAELLAIVPTPILATSLTAAFRLNHLTADAALTAAATGLH